MEFVVLEAGKYLFHKFMEQVESIFINLSKPLKYRYFLMNFLILLTDIPLKAQMASVKPGLNKAQIKAITSLKIDKFVWIKYGLILSCYRQYSHFFTVHKRRSFYLKD
jgi:hypothetical protein